MANIFCPICGEKEKIQFTEIVLKKYKVKYAYCSKCGLLHTEPPYWLEEAYNTPISNTDTGLIQRNLYNSKIIACLVYFLFGKTGKYLDIAGGYGILTRLMRDSGFVFYWSDKYCENLFAKGFELNTTKPPFTAITAFEVLEHIYDPIAFLRDSLRNFETKTILFSTLLFKDTPPKPSEWWYYSFDTGQHISFYQENTLRFIARELGLNVYTHNNLHVMTNEHLNAWVFRILTNNQVTSILFNYICKKMKSRTLSDRQQLSDR